MNQSEITVKVASSVAEIDELRHFWTRLNYHPESDIDFVLMLASVRPEILRPYIVVACNDRAEPVALVVGRVERTLINIKIGYVTLFKIPLSQLVFVPDGYLGEYSERIAEAIIEHIAQALRGNVAERALLCSIPIESSLHGYTKGYFGRLQRDFSRRVGEHWRASLPNDFNEFLGRRPKKQRHELRRTTKIFERQFIGKVKYAILEGPYEVDLFCSAAETVAKNTYQRGLGTGFIDNVENRERLALAARKGWFRSYMVFVEDVPLAFWSGERVGDMMYLIWTGFDPLYRKYEVGTILFLKMVEDFLAQGIKQIDFGLGWAKYKKWFGNQCLQEQDIIIFAPTLKGYSVNLICAMDNIVNQSGKRFLAWLNISEKIKRIWRSNLAAKATLVSESASKAQFSDDVNLIKKTSAWNMLKNFAVFQELKSAAKTIESVAIDWCMNVKTGTPVYFSHARGINLDAFDFEANAHSTIIKAIRLVRLAPSDVVFVLGCGQGRAVCHFARQRIRKVVGVELEPQLCEAAKKNGQTLTGRKAEIEIHNIDAALEDTSEGTVFFMFNPFGEQTLRMVLKNIEATLNGTSKSITIIYARPLYSYVFSEFSWLNILFDYENIGGLHVIIYRNQLSER